MSPKILLTLLNMLEKKLFLITFSGMKKNNSLSSLGNLNFGLIRKNIIQSKILIRFY